MVNKNKHINLEKYLEEIRMEAEKYTFTNEDIKRMADEIERGDYSCLDPDFVKNPKPFFEALERDKQRIKAMEKERKKKNRPQKDRAEIEL